MGYKEKNSAADKIYLKMKDFLPPGRCTRVWCWSLFTHGFRPKLVCVFLLDAIDIIDNRELFSQTAKKDYTGFRPLGTKAGEYRIQHEDYENSVFEFYDVRYSFCGCSSLQKPSSQEIHTEAKTHSLSPCTLCLGNLQYAEIQKLPQETGMLRHLFHWRRFFHRGHGWEMGGSTLVWACDWEWPRDL